MINTKLTFLEKKKEVDYKPSIKLQDRSISILRDAFIKKNFCKLFSLTLKRYMIQPVGMV